MSVLGEGPNPERSERGGGGGGGVEEEDLGTVGGVGRLEEMKGEGAAETETGMEARGGLGGRAGGTDW